MSEEQTATNIANVAPMRRSDDGQVMIDFRDIRTLVGRLLTYTEATFTDTQQRKAQKRLVNQLVYDWGHELYESAGIKEVRSYPDPDHLND